MTMILELLAAVGTLQQAPCNLEALPPEYEQQQSIECGWVTVPKLHEKENSKKIKIWTARVRGTGSEQQADAVLYINGGPGIATVDSILPYLERSKTMGLLRQGRDVILFDQRGSGRSEEALCPSLAKQLHAISIEGHEPAEEASLQRAAFIGCRKEIEQTGGDLGAYTTHATVSDIEVIRKAYGITKWNIAAISYGTLVALHAMRTHPDHIRSVILNSPYPPNSSAWAEQSSSAAAGFEAIDRACSLQQTCSDKFGRIVPKLEATLARLEQSPLPDGTKLITGRKFAQAIWPLAVQSSTVKYVPLAIERAASGDVALIKKLTSIFGSGDSFGGFSPAQARAISCYESGKTANWYSRARALYPAMVSASPDDSWDLICEAYRPGFAAPSFFAPVASDIPALVYAGALDPATPSIDAYQTTRLLQRARVVEVPDGSHGPMVVDACTIGIAKAFLATPTALPSLECMLAREKLVFATEGLDEFLTPGG